jgi:fructokinase
MTDAGASAARPGAPRLFVGLGELLWDRFPDGRFAPGGAPANAAYHAAVLGDRAVLVSRVGVDDDGDAAVAELAARGVDVRFVQRDPALPTGTVEVEIDERGDPRYRIASPVAWDRITCGPEVTALLIDADVLCHGTLLARTAEGRRTLAAAREATGGACLRVCDLNLRPPFVTDEIVREAIAGARVVKISEHDAALVGAALAVGDPIGWVCEQPGVEIVAVTRGARGCVVFDGGARTELPGFQIDAEAGAPAAAGGDAVGAGDAFTAAFAHHLVRGGAPAHAAARANEYAAHVAAMPGGMPPVPAALRARITEP